MTDNLSVLETSEISMEELIQTNFSVVLPEGEYQLNILETFVDNNVAFIEYGVTDPFGGSGLKIGIEYHDGVYALENPGMFEELENSILAALNGDESALVYPEAGDGLIVDGHAGYVNSEMLNDFINANNQLRTVRGRIIAELNKWQNGITPDSPIGRYPNSLFMVIGSINISFIKIGDILVPSAVCKSDRFRMTESSYNQAESDAQRLLTRYSVEA